MKLSRSLLCLALAAFAGGALAQSYPARPVKIIVAFTPGSVSYTHLTLPTNREV